MCALIGESATIRVTESFLLTAVSTFNPRVMNVCASWVEIPTPTRSNHSHPVGMSQLADAMGIPTALALMTNKATDAPLLALLAEQQLRKELLELENLLLESRLRKLRSDA